MRGGSNRRLPGGSHMELYERLGLRPIWEMIKRRMADTPEEKR
jgi:hypothetical protein